MIRDRQAGTPRRRAYGWRLRGVMLLMMLASGVLPAARPAAAQVLNFRNYTATDGLPQSQILAIHQDARNYLWLGTYAGLSRYDGDEFRTWAVADGLGANAVTVIDSDARGRLHIGAIGGGVCTLDDGAVHCIRERDGLPHDDVLDLIVDHDGLTVWVGTTRGIARVRDGVVSTFGEPGGASDGAVHRIVRDRAGRLVAAGERGLLAWNGTRFEPLHATVLGAAAVDLAFDTRHGLLVASGSRLFLERDGSLTALPVAAVSGGALITDGATDREGVVWITTRAGVLRWDGSRFDRYTAGSGLLDDQVNRVRTDREGNVWFGTERGLSRLTPGPFRHYTQRQGIPNPFVRAISADRTGRIWLGTRDGIAVREGDGFRALDLGPGITDRRIFSLAPMPAGGMLVGSRVGLIEHDGRRVRRVHRAVETTATGAGGGPDGLPGNAIFALVPDGAGGVWVGTDRGLAHWKDGRVRPITGIRALEEMFVISMALDARGRLWLGGRSGGVVIYDGATVTAIGEAQGLTNQTIWSIGRDRRGTMWIGSNGDGVFSIAPHELGEIRQLTAAGGLADDFIWQVRPNADGAVWLYGSRGLDRVASDGIQHYGRGRGLLELEGSAGASWEDGAGELWFGTSSGLVRYTPALDRPAAFAPMVYVEAVTLGADTLAGHARVRQAAGVLKIRYSSPTFADETSLRFRFRLLGTDTTWSLPTTERNIGYANLGPGEYEFQVYALNEDGMVSDTVASFSFVVAPRYWQTLWFRLAVLVLTLGAGSAFGVWRMRGLQSERRRLEGLVHTRTRELRERNYDLVREVAERQRAEDALRSSQQRMSDIIGHSTNMFYAHEADGKLTFVSPQSRAILGCEPAEAMRRYHDFVTEHPANAVANEHTLRALATGEQQPPYPMELRGMDGRLRWVEVNEAPVVRNGVVTGVVGSLTDITETRRAAQEQERLESQLRQAQKLEAVGRLAGGIAHDFNNLLTAVVGNTELVSSALPPEDPLQAELGQVRCAADRAAALVVQLLAFSRQQLIRRSVLDLNTVVSESARMLTRMIGADVELHLELGGSTLYIEADKSQLDQILINLALNARDAMPKGGRLVIATEPVTLDGDGQAALDDSLPAGDYVALRICDTGHGMDAETSRRVFEPFFTTKDVGRGTGLGLATVYGIVTQNGGAVHIDSATGQGTTFHIYLPRAVTPGEVAEPGPVEVQGAAVPVGPGVPQARHARILVVEDEEAVRRLVCRSLRRYGHEVIEAASGADAVALSAADGEPIDMLLTDMVMPGMNGRQAAARIARARPGIRILYMSGHTRDVLGTRFMLDDATRVVQKPFTPAELAGHVHRLLDANAADLAGAA